MKLNLTAKRNHKPHYQKDNRIWEDRIIGGLSAKEHHRIHAILRSKHGSANKCENENCVSVNPTKFEWALIRGRSYSTDPKDYMQLCKKCHRRYDITDEFTRKCILRTGGKTVYDTRKQVKRIDGSGNIDIYESLIDAAKANGLLKTSISNCIAGRSKTSGGYQWQFIPSPPKPKL